MFSAFYKSFYFPGFFHNKSQFPLNKNLNLNENGNLNEVVSLVEIAPFRFRLRGN